MGPTWIAEEKVVFVHPSGKRAAGRIAIAGPVQIDANEAHCAIALEGCQPAQGPIIGGSPLQALLLAARFIGSRLHDFVSSGGRVVDPGGDDLPLESFFGPLLCDVRP